MKLVSDHNTIIINDDGILHVLHINGLKQILIKFPSHSRNLFLAATQDPIVAYDAEQQGIVDVYNTIYAPTNPRINTQLTKRLMTSATKFCLTSGRLVLYSRHRLWICMLYLQLEWYSNPIIPARYGSHFTANRPLDVSVHIYNSVVHQRSDRLVIHTHIMYRSSVRKSIMCVLPHGHRIISAVADYEGTTVITRTDDGRAHYVKINVDTGAFAWLELDQHDEYAHTEDLVGVIIDGLLRPVHNNIQVQMERPTFIR